MTVVWTAPALTALEAIYDYLYPRNPVAARRLIEDLVIAGDSLSEFPQRGRPRRVEGTRELTIVRPYLMIYRIVDDEVRILSIWHSAQYR